MLSTLILFGSLFHHHHHHQPPPHVPGPLGPHTIAYCAHAKKAAIEAFKEYPALTSIAIDVYQDSLVVEGDNAESPSLETDVFRLIDDFRSLRWAEDDADNRSKS